MTDNETTAFENLPLSLWDPYDWDVFGARQIIVHCVKRPQWLKRQIMRFLLGSIWVKTKQ